MRGAAHPPARRRQRLSPLSLPERVRTGVERALPELGLGRRVERLVPVSGGCINNGARVQTDSAHAVFLKWNASAPAGLFDAEADGLRALEAASTLRVPRPLAWEHPDDGAAWLLMEWVAPARADREAELALGRGLARMHDRRAGPGFGWERDNWIGSLHQSNAPTESWADFWRDRRIGPQLTLARRHGRARDEVFDRLLDVIPHALADVDAPSLVHGDLWGGNWFADERGAPVVIDPAVYRGHGEVDLAMSELFGGFGPAFHDGYREVLSVTDAYAAYRKDLYQLYYLLVHVNLFGTAYEAGSLRAAQAVLNALR